MWKQENKNELITHLLIIAQKILKIILLLISMRISLHNLITRMIILFSLDVTEMIILYFHLRDQTRIFGQILNLSKSKPIIMFEEFLNEPLGVSSADPGIAENQSETKTKITQQKKQE